MKDSDKKAIILYGPPGSGKGTQAKLLADRFGFFHFDTGDFLRKIVHDPKLQKNKIIQRERKLNDEGKLQTPSFVLKFVSHGVQELIRLGQGVIFSGSPRTLYEAFGNKKTKGLTEILGKGYGKQKIFIFILAIPEKESIARNSERLSCSICKTTLLAPKLQDKKVKFQHCPFCGGKVAHRIDDNKEIILTRLKEYRERTKPIFQELQKRRYRLYKISGAPVPYKIHQRIVSILEK